jgi:hypothetical protein
MIDLVLYGFLAILAYIIVKELVTRSSVAYKTAQKFPGPYLYPFLGNIPAVAFLDPGELIDPDQKYRVENRNQARSSSFWHSNVSYHCFVPLGEFSNDVFLKQK